MYPGSNTLPQSPLGTPGRVAQPPPVAIIVPPIALRVSVPRVELHGNRGWRRLALPFTTAGQVPSAQTRPWASSGHLPSANHRGLPPQEGSETQLPSAQPVRLPEPPDLPWIAGATGSATNAESKGSVWALGRKRECDLLQQNCLGQAAST